MAVEATNHDYPEEIDDQLTSFDSSVSSVKTMLEKLMSIPRNEQPQKVDTLTLGFTDILPSTNNRAILRTVRQRQKEWWFYLREGWDVCRSLWSITCLPFHIYYYWGHSTSISFRNALLLLNVKLLLTAQPFGSSQVGSDVCLHT